MENIKSYEQLNESLYDSNRLYKKESIVKKLRRGPAYLRPYLKKLPDIPCKDVNGNDQICTQIPEVVFRYIFGNF
jgi:hypothetical protein